MESFFSKFKLQHERENFETVSEQIEKSVVFRGTNLWVLILAIFVASLGLNVNSTAVIIGAMLISPLMGPIMGMGFGLGTNDITLLKKALYNFIVATIVALATSTLFFIISPINDAHSEILARTSPNIYDVLIALFGGFAGMLATSSKNKGNVITGVAIATALMPPLCTAGYGLATFQFNYFWGAFYLFVINTVFIALATFFVVKFLHFPLKDLHNPKLQKIASRVVTIIVLITLLPSIYFGYDMIEQNNYERAANVFIEKEAVFSNDYLLSKKIDTRKREINLIFGGREITQPEIETLKLKLKKYNLTNTQLFIKQGFSSFIATNTTTLTQQQLLQQDLIIQQLQKKVDSTNTSKILNIQIYKELKAQNQAIQSVILEPSSVYSDSTIQNTFLVVIKSKTTISVTEQQKIANWLRVRLQNKSIELIVQL